MSHIEISNKPRSGSSKQFMGPEFRYSGGTRSVTRRQTCLGPGHHLKNASDMLNPSKFRGQEAFILLVVSTPSEKYESQLGLLFPIYGKIKNVPNHQPVIQSTVQLIMTPSNVSVFDANNFLH